MASTPLYKRWTSCGGLALYVKMPKQQDGLLPFTVVDGLFSLGMAYLGFCFRYL